MENDKNDAYLQVFQEIDIRNKIKDNSFHKLDNIEDPTATDLAEVSLYLSPEEIQKQIQSVITKRYQLLN